MSFTAWLIIMAWAVFSLGFLIVWLIVEWSVVSTWIEAIRKVEKEDKPCLLPVIPAHSPTTTNSHTLTALAAFADKPPELPKLADYLRDRPFRGPFRPQVFLIPSCNCLIVFWSNKENYTVSPSKEIDVFKAFEGGDVTGCRVWLSTEIKQAIADSLKMEMSIK